MVEKFVSAMGIISHVAGLLSTKGRMKYQNRKFEKETHTLITIIRQRKWKTFTIKIYFDQPSQH